VIVVAVSLCETNQKREPQRKGKRQRESGQTWLRLRLLAQESGNVLNGATDERFGLRNAQNTM
jgi:hypothetical protein